jgi:DNA repair ATPase RecN
LLDEREEIRSLARDVWARISKGGICIWCARRWKSAERKIYTSLQTLSDLMSGSGYTRPFTPQTATPAAQRIKLSPQEEKKLIEGSTLVKRLLREVKETAEKLKTKTSEYTKLEARESTAIQDLASTRSQLDNLRKGFARQSRTRGE